MSLKAKKEDLPPLIRQYLDVKEQYHDALIFFRCGDFYELFFEDAEVAASELGIVLTQKTIKHQSIPMAGVPHHAYKHHLIKLINSGYKVAICEQTETAEDAKLLKKSVIDREVIRIVTAGTLTEEEMLLDGGYNFLATIGCYGPKVAVSWVDVSTGEFYVQEAAKQELHNILYRINPKEILIREKNLDLLAKNLRDLVTVIAAEKFNYISAHNTLTNFYKINLSAALSQLEIITSGVLLDYLALTQKGLMPHLSTPKVWNSSSVMRLDFFTRRSLELDKKLNGEYKGSLRSIIDKTCTKGGKRLLQQWLMGPLLDDTEINLRLNVVDYFINNKTLLQEVSTTLKNVPDLTRVFTNIILNRGGPRDLYLIRIGLDALTGIRNILIGTEMPTLVKESLLSVGDYSYIQQELKCALKDYEDLPISTKSKSSNFIAPNYRPELEFFKKEYNNTLNEILQLQERYALTADIPNTSLKIHNNNVIGYYLEVTPKYAPNLFNHNIFIHKQTLNTGTRFTTTELMEKEATIIKLTNQIDAFEGQIYQELVDLVSKNQETIQKASETIALLDVLTSFANLACEYHFTKPIVNNSNNLCITSGWHPVVERGLKLQEEKTFTTNDCIMKSNDIYIITGPNMAGKSTFLRQNAIIIILAQIGCYVPAVAAEIGIIDSIFSRVGASDNLYQGQSTFMVEMIETAVILTNATERSFVILDEVGRGTATYDGLSIACAIIYYLHDQLKAKVLFATHYHELTALKNSLINVDNFHMKVAIKRDELIFMYQIQKGETNQSHGIYAAKLAGMPQDVINKAQYFLSYFANFTSKDMGLLGLQPQTEPNLTSTIETELNANQSNSNSCRDSAQTIVTENQLSVCEYLKTLDLDSLSPKEALKILYNVQEQINNE